MNQVTAQTAIIISICGVIISFLGLFISFLNVNRQRKASLINDEEKFKRELNLKTSDESIELLYTLIENLKQYRTLENKLVNAIRTNSTDDIKELNEQIWTLIESWMGTSRKIEEFFLKRFIVLKEHEEYFLKIRDIGWHVDNDLWRFKVNFFTNKISEKSNRELIAQLHYLLNKSEELIEIVNTTIINIQSHYLGHLYRKKNTTLIRLKESSPSDNTVSTLKNG